MKFTAEMFVAESNRIEGITRPPSEAEINEFRRFMMLDNVCPADLVQFVSVYQPGAVLRTELGLDVRVGSHIPPRGGPAILVKLEKLLCGINSGDLDAYRAHIIYETIHPFTDGNGRSGRMLWAWMMQDQAYRLGFLHMFYYQALQNSR